MISFLELLQIYKWSLPASVLMAGVLALCGGQWTARGKSAQIFVLGQGASLGIILGLVLNILLGTDLHFLSLAVGMSLGWVTLIISDKFVTNRNDQNHIYLTLFVFFLALTYLITSLTPSLESHIAASYFGDLVVMSDLGAQVCLVAAAVFGFFTLRHWRHLTRVSFELINQSWVHRSWRNQVFDVGTLLLTTLAIQNMGYLFTMGSLFIGTSFAASISRNLAGYQARVLFISLGGCSFGFLLSLVSPNLPTVPCVLLGQMLFGVLSLIKR